LKISKELRVGFMSVIAIALLIFGYNFLKGKNLLENSRIFYAVYEQVEGLNPSSAVTINGFQVGAVTDIEILPDARLLVTLNINNDFPFSKSSVAEIYGGGFIGGKSIAIVPNLNDKTLAQSGDTLNSEIEEGLLELVNKQLTPLQAQIESAVSDIDTLVTSFNFVLDENSKDQLKQSITNFSTSMENLASISQKTNTLLDDNSDNIKKSFENFTEVTSKLNSLTDSLNKVEFGKLVRELEFTLNNFKSISEKINNGEGNLGKMLNDDTLYTNLENSTKQLEELLQDMKLNPKRYVHFSVFGKKNKEYQKPEEDN
jgi:phospholipid/cholesterol/gamma-HCH transport system substrate-binding protein